MGRIAILLALVSMASCYLSRGMVGEDARSETEGRDSSEIPELDIECPLCGDKECGWVLKWHPDAERIPIECRIYYKNFCGLCGKDEICSIDGTCVPGGCMGECDEEVFVPASLFCWEMWDDHWGEEVPLWFDQCYGTGWSSEIWIDDFYIDKYEVTNRRYRRCFEAGICPEGENYIIIEVDREVNYEFDIEDYFYDPAYDNYPALVMGNIGLETFCLWEGKRLPTKEEWMKAALGGCLSSEHCNPVVDMKKYPWGNEDPENCSMANFSYYGFCVGFYQPVGAYPSGASPYGMMDAYGNAMEWLQSFVDEEGRTKYPYVSSSFDGSHPALINNIYFVFNPHADPVYPQDPQGHSTVGGRCARDP
jgi:hypothetical protein